MEKISAVIITGNEEKNIGRCLASLQGIADEVIVIDSFSTDGTKNICEQYGAYFERKEFIDYSDQKNYANALAQYPIIFSIDADEELSEELKKSVLAIKADFKADGYSVNRRTNYCGKWIRYCGWYPDTKLRFWRKEKASWKGAIHETLEFTGTKGETLKGDLLHYSFPTMEGHVAKLNRYAEMAAKEMFERGKKASLFKMLTSPIFEFIKKYILQRGFLDGYYGFVICTLSAYNKFYKFAKLKHLWIQAGKK